MFDSAYFAPEYNGEYEGTCMTPRCYVLSKVKPKARWFDKQTKTWVCLRCAQEMNKEALQYHRPKRCIEGKEYMWSIIGGSYQQTG